MKKKKIKYLGVELVEKIYKRIPKDLETHPIYGATGICIDVLGNKIGYDKYGLTYNPDNRKQGDYLVQTATDYFTNPVCVIEDKKYKRVYYYGIINNRVCVGTAEANEVHYEGDKIIEGADYKGSINFFVIKKIKKNGYAEVLRRIKQQMKETEITKESFLYVRPDAKNILKFLEKPEINTPATLRIHAKRREKERQRAQIEQSPEFNKIIMMKDVQDRKVVYTLAQLYVDMEKKKIGKKAVPHFQTIVSDPDWITRTKEDNILFYYRHIGKELAVLIATPFEYNNEEHFGITFAVLDPITPTRGRKSKAELSMDKLYAKSKREKIEEVYIRPDSKYDFEYIKKNGLKMPE